jgi:hypothetical protein
MKDILASTVLATDRDVRAQYADHRMREGQGRRQMPPPPSFTSLHSFQQTSGKWLAPSVQIKHFSYNTEMDLKEIRQDKSIHVAQGGLQLQALVNTIMNLRIP